jgi:hypothetical protein
MVRGVRHQPGTPLSMYLPTALANALQPPPFLERSPWAPQKFTRSANCRMRAADAAVYEPKLPLT